MINGIENIDIRHIIGQYVELKKSGKWLIGLCPFHDEKTPSFFVYRKRFKCFGCSESGDVVDFIQKIEGLDFKGALKRLGIKNGAFTYEEQKRIKDNKLRQKAIKDLRNWEDRFSDEVAILLRCCRKCVASIKTEAEMEKYASIFHAKPLLEFWFDILLGKDDNLKAELRRSVGN